MSLTWPYPDPHFAAYMLNAAAAASTSAVGCPFPGAHPVSALQPAPISFSYYEAAWRAALNGAPSQGAKLYPYG